jgi:hypothetical protein
MPNFKIVNNSGEITLSNKWISSTKFNSKDRLVDAKGKVVSSDYKGRQYRIIEKRECTFSTPQRIGRGFLGALTVVCTLFLALFSRSIRNLFTNQKENVRFGILEPSKQTHQVPPTISSPEPKKEEKNLQQNKLLEEQMFTKLDLENKRKEQIDWCERTNKEEEKKYQEELSKLNEKFPDTESGRRLKARRIELLTNSYNRGIEYRKQALNDYLSDLEHTRKTAMDLVTIFSS